MNRRDLEKKLGSVTAKLITEKGFICMIDVFVALGYLTHAEIEAWRKKQIPYLERVISVNLSKISLIVKTVRKNCIKGRLKESYTSYRSWGKGKKIRLRFSKSGNDYIEKVYATHYLTKKKEKKKAGNENLERE